MPISTRTDYELETRSCGTWRIGCLVGARLVLGRAPREILEVWNDHFSHFRSDIWFGFFFYLKYLYGRLRPYSKSSHSMSGGSI
jgi:hypothetical protein